MAVLVHFSDLLNFGDNCILPGQVQSYQYFTIVAKSHCFTVRLKILAIVSHQTLIISLQNWVKGSLIFITANKNLYS